MDKTKLSEIGFGKSEAEIYLSLLRIGKANVTQLTKETGIHRTYIYDLLEKLKEKGLVNSISEDNKQFFQASNPEKLKENLLEKANLAEKIIPELKKIMSKSEETKVEVYKGKEGVKTILNDIVRTKKDYYAIGTFKEFEDLLPEHIVEQFLLKINKIGLKERAILRAGEKVKEAKRHEYKYLPKEYLFLSSVIIYGDKTALFIWKEPYLQILIKNKDITKTYLTQFNALWKMARKII